MQIKSHQGRLAVVVCLGWGLGSAGLAAMNLSRALILRFMTDFLEIAAVTAGLLFALSKIFDAITDPLMGLLIDKSGDRAGRRNLYILVGAILCPLAYLLIFNVPGAVTPALMPGYMLLVMLVFAIALTLFGVPYLTMPVDIAPNYHQRNTLLSFRAIGIAVGGLVGGLMAPLLIAMNDRSREAHEVMSWAVAATIFAFLFVTFLTTRKLQFRQTVRVGGVSLSGSLQLLSQHCHFLILLVSKFVFFTGVSMLNASSAFFTQYVLAASDRIIALFYLCFFVAMVLFQPLWIRLGKTFSKHRLFISLCLLLALVNLTWLAAAADEPRLFFVMRALLTGALFGGVIVMGHSMLPDTMEFDRNRTGLHREGMFAGIFTFVEKASTALGVALVGLILGLMNYQESSDAAVVEQPASAITAIYWCFSAGPAILIALGAIVMLGYRLTETALVESNPGLRPTRAAD